MSSITPIKEKSFPTSCTESGDIHFALSKTAKKLKNVIYQFFDEETGRSFIGKTAQPLGKRISSHESAINTGKVTELYQAIRERPYAFSLRILARAENSQELDDLEEKYIKEFECVEKGYNKNGGRGGGKKIEQSDRPFIPPAKTTPDRYFPVERRKDGSIGIELTPNTKKTGPAVYVLRNWETDERYIGMTVRKAGDRVNEHVHLINHPEKETGQRRLYNLMRKHPERFGFGILHQPQKDQIKASETHHIGIKDSFDNGYNKTHGHRPPAVKRLKFSEQIGPLLHKET